MNVKAQTTNPIRLKRNVKIGELDAESDLDLLFQCFVESEVFTELMDCSNPHSIAIGRVGAGKSALLQRIKAVGHRSIHLDPRSLAFHYIENSTILKFVESLGVNLNTFYKLLWRHVLVVELLRARYNLVDDKSQRGVFDSIERLVGFNQSKRKALDYVRTWGDRFWEETEVRVKEVTHKIEREIDASVGADIGPLSLAGSGKHTLSKEQNEEIRSKATRVVDSIQIRQLSEVLNLLADDVFDDPQKAYYILIDDLDQEWASTDTRCRLIRALIEEVKTFRRIESVKVVVAIRQDLLSMVYDRTRGSGFQEEKYESLLAPITWNERELRQLIDQRLRTVFKRQYSTGNIHFDDIFPPTKGGGEPAFEYLIQRTIRRPRDVIQFVNTALSSAAGKPRVSWNDLKQAENIYSQKRLKSLFEEWSDVFPALSKTIEVLRGVPHQFSRSYLKATPLQTLISSLWESPDDDPCVHIVKLSLEPHTHTTTSDVLTKVIQCLYQVGAIGLKPDSNTAYLWSYLDQPTISEGEIKRSDSVRVHKMLWQALNIIPEQRKIEEILAKGPSE